MITMQIPLQHIEQSINPVILERGLNYFKSGHVSQFIERAGGVFEATVKGTTVYHVSIKLENEIVTESTCDCPYNFGPTCKHIAAVIYYLLKDELDLKPNKAIKKMRKGTVKKTPAEQVSALLEKLPHHELKRFVLDLSIEDKLFCRQLLTAHAHLNEDESKTFYAGQIRAIIKSASSRGFIDRRGAHKVGKAMNNFLVTGQNQLDKGNHRSTIFMASAMLEELTKALQFSDDSNGDFGDGIYSATELLSKVAERKLQEKERKLLFDYTLKAYQKNLYTGWDWHLGMLEIAAKLIKTENEGEKVIDLLNQVKREEFDYHYQKAQGIKLEIIAKIKGEEEAEAFMMMNLSNPTLREAAISSALQRDDFEQAVSLAEEGLLLVPKDLPGLALEWTKWLLRIAIQKGDSVKTIESARILFLNVRADYQYLYFILKENVREAKWKGFVADLISEIQAQKQWLDFQLLAKIYVSEELWLELLALLKQEITQGSILPGYLQDFEEHLVPNYSQELAHLYELGILRFLEKNVGRNYYRSACKNIKRMNNLGATEMAKELIERLKVIYSQRPALLEELERI